MMPKLNITHSIPRTLPKTGFRGVFAAALILLSMVGYAQTATITWVQISGTKIIVHYDLETSNPNQEFAISLYTSKDNFSAPLSKVTGDVGNEIKPGKDKQITWDVVAELGNYRGDLELEIRGKVFVPFMKLSNFDTDKKYKRGKSYPLVWTSNEMSGQVDIELYNGQTRVTSDRGVPNTGKFEWFLPGNVKPGKNYVLRFTNAKNREESISTGQFSVVPKVSMVVKGLVGLAIIGGGVAAAGAGGGGGGGGGGTTKLPLPPIPE
jgi:hypothetical protein